MNRLGLGAVLAAGLLEAGYMAWTRLPVVAPEYDWPTPPVWLQKAFPRFKFGGGLVGLTVIIALFSGTQPQHLGIEPSSNGTEALTAGIQLGFLLYMGTELMIYAVKALGLTYDPGYDQIFANSPGGWPFLLGIVLPAISLREELIYRVALIGVGSVLLGVSPWVLAVVSTLVFGSVHFTGDGGVVIAAIGGGVLAIAFILTNSLLTIVIAHTIVNVTEFLVHYAFGTSQESQHNSSTR